MKSKVLIVDDEKDICFLISEILKDENYITTSANNSDEALKEFSIFHPDLIILDIWLGNSNLDGIELLKKFKTIDLFIPIIIISGHGTVDMAVNSIKNGAYDFLEKPFNSDKLIVLSKRAIENANLIKENNLLRKIADSNTIIVGKSNFILDCLSNARTLISGPIGSGKKLIAQTIHKISKRSNSLANIIDFSTLSDEQLNELFDNDINHLNNNIFFNSNNGTLIFQNIDMASLKYQKKILLYLENPEIFEKMNIKFNIKIILLTSSNLIDEIKKGNFLKDLFYRINVIPINIPTINDRREDIMPLCNYYLDKYNRNNKYKFSLSKIAVRKLEANNWPGNVRQISNYMERLIILNQNNNLYHDFEIPDILDDMIKLEDNLFDSNNALELSIKEARDKFEREYFMSQIKRFNGNILKISQITGMERTALYRKIKSLNIDLNKY